MHISKRHLLSALALIVLGSALYAGHAFAATVYVSNSATNGYASGNDSNTYVQAQSKETPLLTVTSALAKVSTGDTIVINDGTYTEAGQLIAADDNLTLTNDSVTGATNGVVIRAATGSRIFHSTYVSPGAGFTFGPIVLDANNTQSSVVTVDGSNDINLLTFNGTRLLNPVNYWITSSRLRNLEMTGTWSASANVATAFIGFYINGGASNNGTYNISGGTISKTNTGATYAYILSSTPAVSGLTVNFTNNVVTMDGASASAVHKTIAFGAGAVPITVNVNNNDLTFSGSNTQNVNFISMLDTTIALTAFSNDITATGNHAIITAINSRGLASVNIYSNTFDYSGATISSSSNAITVGNGAGTTSSCIVHDNSGDLNSANGVAVAIGDDADPGPNSNHITSAVVYNNNFSNNNHGYLMANITGAHVYRNIMNNAVIGVASKYSTNIQFDNNILKNITTGGALREKGGTGAKFYNNTVTLANGGAGIYLSDGASGGIYKNNVIWSDQSSPQFVNILAGTSATLDNNLYYYTQSLPADAWVNGASNYSTLSAWQAATALDANSLNTDPLLVDIAGGDYYPQSLSPVIDAGADASLTADYSGNDLYGVPDIGAYEYQPPYTFAANDAPKGGAVRLYTDGQYRVTSSGSGTATFAVAPSGGYTASTTEYMNISIDAWSTTGTEVKQWTATSTAGSFKTQATDTLYTIGDLTANKQYNLTVDGAVSADVTGYGDTTCTNGICDANSSGVLQFVYTGGYASARTFATSLLQTAITNVTATVLSATSVQITWDTNDAADSTVQYGLTAAYGSTSSDVSLVTSHSMTLTGLTPGTAYHYNVLSDGNTSVSSSDATFTTDAATSITNVTATVLSATSVTITWTTNHAADSTVQYGTTIAYGSTSSSVSLVTSHSITLTGLTPGTTYHYRVLSEGNTSASSSDATFTTDAATVITHVTATVVSTSSVIITWTTNHAADSQVQYGKTTSYGDEKSDVDLVTSHSIILTGLTPGTTYHYKVLSEGNTSTSSADATFTTTKATVIRYTLAHVLSATSAKITWTTNDAADSKVRYGLSTAYGLEEYDATLTTDHSITLTDLTPGTTYHYEVLSVGNTSTNDADATFTTEEEAAPAPTPESLTGFGDVQLNDETAEDSGAFTAVSVLKAGNIVLEGTAEENATITLRIASPDEYTTTTTSDSSGDWSVDIDVAETPLDLGEHSVYGTITKNGSTTSEVKLADFTLYTSAYLPSPTILTPDDDTTNIEDLLTITGLARSGNTVHLYIDGEYLATVQATTDDSGTGNFSYHITSALSSGAHTLYAVAVSGNSASRNAPDTTFSVEPPFIGITFLDAYLVQATPEPYIAFEGIGAGGSRVDFYLNDEFLDRIGLLNGYDSVEHFTYKLYANNLVPKGYTLYAIAYDQDGKPSRKSNVVCFTKSSDVAASILVTSLGSAPVPAMPSQQPPPLPAVIMPGPGGTYTVQGGDSLWKIAQDQLGDGSRYAELVALNQNAHPELLTSPGSIYTGWILRLP